MCMVVLLELCLYEKEEEGCVRGMGQGEKEGE